MVVTDVSTIHFLDRAFMRRGMALHTTGLMPWTAHEQWRQKLMSSLHLIPLRAGFAPPDMTDVLCADKAIWNFMERACPDHIRPASGTAVASFPLVTAMEAALNEPEVKDFLKCQPAYLKSGTKPSANAAAAALSAPGGQAPASGAAKDAKKVKKKEKKAKAKAKAKASAKRLEKLEKQVAKGNGKGGARECCAPSQRTCRSRARPQNP